MFYTECKRLCAQSDVLYTLPKKHLHFGFRTDRTLARVRPNQRARACFQNADMSTMMMGCGTECGDHTHTNTAKHIRTVAPKYTDTFIQKRTYRTKCARRTAFAFAYGRVSLCEAVSEMEMLNGVNEAGITYLYRVSGEQCCCCCRCCRRLRMRRSSSGSSGVAAFLLCRVLRCEWLRRRLENASRASPLAGWPLVLHASYVPMAFPLLVGGSCCSLCSLSLSFSFSVCN